MFDSTHRLYSLSVRLDVMRWLMCSVVQLGPSLHTFDVPTLLFASAHTNRWTGFCAPSDFRTHFGHVWCIVVSRLASVCAAVSDHSRTQRAPGCMIECISQDLVMHNSVHLLALSLHDCISATYLWACHTVSNVDALNRMTTPCRPPCFCSLA